MADQNSTTLPEGTDEVITGASTTATDGDTAVTFDDVPVTTGTTDGTISDRLRSGRDKLGNQAGEKARGLVTQGLERTSEALAHVSKMVGDTADGIEERLGPEYGDYARRAAGAIGNVANTLASKDPDELSEDTRNLVRNSPGIALAGGAVAGFVVARLVKSGRAKDEDDED